MTHFENINYNAFNKVSSGPLASVRSQRVFFIVVLLVSNQFVSLPHQLFCSLLVGVSCFRFISFGTSVLFCSSFTPSVFQFCIIQFLSSQFFFFHFGLSLFSIIEVALRAVSCQAVQVRFKQFKLPLVLLVCGRTM